MLGCIARKTTLSKIQAIRLAASSKFGPFTFQRFKVAFAWPPKGEQHSTGAEMASDLLRLEGWAVGFLGADVLAEDIVDMVMNRQTRFLGLRSR